MDFQPDLPIPISYVSGRYLLFSIDAVTYLRREHHICGVLIGTLPQIPQQNVFLGLPLELMPEEARLLVDKGVACIVDEAKAHDGMDTLLEEDRRRYLRDLESQGLHISRIQSDRKERNREQTLKKIEEKKANAKAKASAAAQTPAVPDEPTSAPSKNAAIVDLFNTEARSSSPSAGSMNTPLQVATAITPATSYPPLPTPPPSTHLAAPAVPPSYPLFAHLHSKGYFLSPGLRFGCQYMAYPGDPLRFHSHFLVVSYDWDQRIDIMDLVVGGRLGTGVKKGFLIGGAQKGIDEVDSEADRVDTVRAFSLEWAGM
jgi:tRNA-splicing endonuclease subunit Sen34